MDIAAPLDAVEERVTLPFATMWMQGEIICMQYANDLHLSLEVAKRAVEARLYFAKGKSYPILVDMRGIKSTTKAAREHMATIGVTLLKAGALITGSGFNRTLGNIFLAIDKPFIPTKLFTSEAKAREWLQQYL